MRFKVRVKHVDGSDKPWWETYDIPEVHTAAQAEQWAMDMIRRFNNTPRRAGDKAREVIRVWTFGDSFEHAWEKLSLVTERGGYDRMQCKKCGVTGRRYGVGQSGVSLEKPFNKIKYNKCGGKPLPNTMII